jgi:hypothetical protein
MIRAINPCLILLLALLAPTTVAAQTDPAQIDFFEKHIRPVLVNHCYSCHSADAKRIRGDLLLDSRDGLRKGGETGPAIVPGKPAESLLIQALHYEKLQMPPTGKLPANVIADFERWVAMGALDPREKKSVAKKSTIDFTAAKKHWAFQPIRKPELPKVKNSQWPAKPIDTFILAKLEEKGLTPADPADRRTLIRRAYFDLIGLPPTYEEVEAFINDPDPQAFAKIVDKLLASPHYGERWGRHWLDVARYADTKDLVLLFGKNRIRPYAYTYRDYVVRAFNEDVSYDQFIHHQLAADQITPKVEPWQLAAMGYLTLGRLFDNNPHDVYDDQIDAVTRGMLGLTVSCARCHDHKYDPIPTEDYYSLYGVFAGSERPIDLPVIAPSEESPGYQEFEKKMEQKRKELQNHIDSQYNHINDLVRTQVTEYLLRVAVEKEDPLETAVFFLSLSPNDLRPGMITRWRRYLEKHVQPDDPVFGPWHALIDLPAESFAEKSQQILTGWDAAKTNPLVLKELQSAKLTSKTDLVKTYGGVLKRIYLESKTKSNPDDKAARAQLLDILTGPDSPFYYPKSNTYLYMSRVPRGTYSGLLQQIDVLAVDSKFAPPRAMVLVDSPEVYNPKVFLRGNPSSPGPAIPRQFLQILSSPKPTPFPHGSGRLDLAKAITAPDNPLTARVLVNRVWMHHFGEPLVSTPSDFGFRSDPPTHPELLDFLARSIMDNGWSLKKLHRHIMLSKVYQQSSFDRPDCREIDPRNVLLWRFHRATLDLESMRDGLLAVSGRLDPAIGGRPVDIVDDPKNARRTLYGLVDRQDLPELYRTFNFASPDQTAARRPQTTVPQQALFGLNSPFMMEQVKSLVARKEITSAPDDKSKVIQLYRLILQRNPTPAEESLGLRFVQETAREQAGTTLTPWQQYAQVLLLTNEFMFLD